MGRTPSSLHITMKIIAAYMLAAAGGDANVANIKKILAAADYEVTEADSKAMEDLVEAMAGKELSEVHEAGMKTLKDVPLGGGGGAPAAAAGGDAGAAAAAPEEEEEEEEEIAA